MEETAAIGVPGLASYEVILVNSSGGKDSQVVLDETVRLAREASVLDRVTVVHADLGRVEWEGTKELAKKQAEHYGLPFIAVSRPQGDLLTHVQKRGKWPASNARYCTSDHKRGQVRKVMTALVTAARERTGIKRIRVLNVLGIRAQESPARAKKPEFQYDKSASNGRRHVDTWYPIFRWTEKQVWARIKESGVPHHPAYDYGMPRLSCCFCIFAPKAALILAGRHNRSLLDQYVQVEEEIGHTFRKNLPIADVRKAVDERDERDERTNKTESWTM